MDLMLWAAFAKRICFFTIPRFRSQPEISTLIA